MADFCLAAFGEIMLRLSPSPQKRFSQVLPGNLDAFFGGAEANVCAAISNLGARSRFLTVLPENPVSRACVRQLHGIGTDVDHILFKKDGRMGIYFAEQGGMQHSSSVFYDRTGSAISLALPEEYDFNSMLKGCTQLLVSGITPGISENAFRVTMDIVQKAVEMGLSICCDVNYRSKLWKWGSGKKGKELAKECISKLLAYSSVVISSMGELEDVFDIRFNSEISQKSQIEKYTWAAQQFLPYCPNARIIAIPLRDSFSAECINWGGMLYDCNTGKSYIAPVNSANQYDPYMLEHVIDSFGGGDAFTAGLIFALQSVEWNTPEQAIRFASAYSCLKHTHPGDYNLTELNEVVSLIDGGGKGNINR